MTNSAKWNTMSDEQLNARIDRETQAFIRARDRRDRSRSGEVISAMDERMERVVARVEALGSEAWSIFIKRVHP